MKIKRKNKTFSYYKHVNKLKMKKFRKSRSCKDLGKFTKQDIFRYEVINPLFLSYHNMIIFKKRINRNKHDKTGKNMNNKKKEKEITTIKNCLDNNKELNDKSQIIIYKPPNSKIKSVRLQNLNEYLIKLNNDLTKTNKTSENIFKPKMLMDLKRRKRRRSRSIYNSNIPKNIVIKKTKVNIEVEINNIEDILSLIEKYPIKPDVEYNINMNAMSNIKTPLIELNSMIGMNKLKESIIDQILYFIQGLHNISDGNGDFMHTVIYGPPGTGKTETAKIMGKIFSKLGVLKQNKFRKVTRADLIAGYLGQTALKTRDVIKDSLGGVLFIDEAYALGNVEKRDSFAKECIDTLCEGLSDHKNDLMVIIAGYKDELERCFFSYNSGLTSRFTWRFKTGDYTYKELFLIFKKKVKDINWKLSDKINDEWFKDKKDDFKYFGRDVETFLSKVKIAHSKRVFCLPKEKKTIITRKDLKKGFTLFTENNNTNDKNEMKAENILKHMYL